MGQEITSRSRLLVAVFFASGFQSMFIIYNPPAIQTAPPLLLVAVDLQTAAGGKGIFLLPLSLSSCTCFVYAYPHITTVYTVCTQHVIHAG